MPFRSACFKRLSQVILRRQDEIVALINKENGKTLVEAYSILMPVLQSIKTYSAMARQLSDGRKVSSTFFLGARSRVHFEPKGVIGYIIPWNFPFELGMKPMIPALAAGNAVVQKPSEQNPLLGELIQGLFTEAGFPTDLVQIVQGYADVGEAVIDHCDAIVFIGSTRVGRKVSERAGKRMIPAILELGGKDAALVLSDADISHTAQGLVQGACFNAGQTCVGIERIYVSDACSAQLTTALQTELGKLRLACDVQDGQYELGPIVVNAQADVYRAHLQDALGKGATLVHGGKILERGGRLYCEPTLLTDCTGDMLIMKEETFGPFLCLQTTSSVDEMIALSNDCDYGLSGSIWTRDVEKGVELAKRMQTGGVMINNSVQIGGCITLPFSGYKQSGMGFLQSEDAYFNFVNRKSIMSHTESLAKDTWMPYKANSVAVTKGLIGMLFGDSIKARAGALVDYLRALLG